MQHVIDRCSMSLNALYHTHAGPIGNACSFQSVPELTTHDNQWSINPYLPGWQPDSMARLALVVSSGSLIEVPILNVRLLRHMLSLCQFRQACTCNAVGAIYGILL